MNIIDNEGSNPIVSVATSDDAATCLTMILEVFKMEIQSGSGNCAENVRRAKRSISSIGIIAIFVYCIVDFNFKSLAHLTEVEYPMKNIHSFQARFVRLITHSLHHGFPTTHSQ